QAIYNSLTEGVNDHEIHVDEQLRQQALIPLDRMLSFSEQLKQKQPANA
ncbi:quinolinate synthase NadA, partial [Alteromonas sp. 14N.309.X.WAT.G.H12]